MMLSILRMLSFSGLFSNKKHRYILLQEIFYYTTNAIPNTRTNHPLIYELQRYKLH